ncbi:MAG: TIGR04282 family arsenosugar biosynthesis glycosyltransferase [Planctomycetota bacterium]|nr:TIGR04282 family arsenosugar biosynthesis glycosyltransferase [Planctomycetota bacterium]
MKLLGMFAKYWEPGQAKTRLAAALNEQRAARVYRAFVETLLHRLAEIGDRRVLAFTPADREHEFRQIQSTWHLQHQLHPGNLGDRMQHFFETALRDGFHRVVLIGSDSPDLPIDVLDRAFDQLRNHDVVLGPSLDGGYYLIGAAGQVPQVFDGMPWSSPDLWKTTVARLTEQQSHFAVLPTWYDVDTLTDLTLLNKKLARRTGDPWLEDLRALVDSLLHDNA